MFICQQDKPSAFVRLKRSNQAFIFPSVVVALKGDVFGYLFVCRVGVKSAPDGCMWCFVKQDRVNWFQPWAAVQSAYVATHWFQIKSDCSCQLWSPNMSFFYHLFECKCNIYRISFLNVSQRSNDRKWAVIFLKPAPPPHSSSGETWTMTDLYNMKAPLLQPCDSPLNATPNASLLARILFWNGENFWQIRRSYNNHKGHILLTGMLITRRFVHPGQTAGFSLCCGLSRGGLLLELDVVKKFQKEFKVLMVQQQDHGSCLSDGTEISWVLYILKTLNQILSVLLLMACKRSIWHCWMLVFFGPPYLKEQLWTGVIWGEKLLLNPLGWPVAWSGWVYVHRNGYNLGTHLWFSS